MEEAYSDVDSTTSEEEVEERMSSSRSEIYDLIVTSELSHKLGRSKAELEYIVNRIEGEMGVTRKSVLLALPEAIRIRYGIPARLNVWLSSLVQGKNNTASNGGGGQSFASLLYVDGLNHGLRNDEIAILVEEIVYKERITSLFALQQMDASDLNHLIWSRTTGEAGIATGLSQNASATRLSPVDPDASAPMQTAPDTARTSTGRRSSNSGTARKLTPGVIYYIENHLLKLAEEIPPSLSIRQALTLLSGGKLIEDQSYSSGTTAPLSTRQVRSNIVPAPRSCMKSPRPSHLTAEMETPEWISQVCICLADRYGFNQVEQITRSLSVADLKLIVKSDTLPYSTFLLLKRFCKDAVPAPTSDFRSNNPSGEQDYEEPSVADLIMRVGSHYGHPAVETEAAKKILVEDNWLTKLEHLRTVEPSYLLQLNLSPIFVKNLSAAMKNPEILRMDIVDTNPASMENRISIREAVDSLKKEVTSEDRKLEVFQCFVRLFQHLILTPNEPTKRLVRKDNPIFRRVEPYRSSFALLHAIGYVEYDDCFLLPVLYMDKTQYAHELMAGSCNGMLLLLIRTEPFSSEFHKDSEAETLPELTRYVSSAWGVMKDQISAAYSKS